MSARIGCDLEAKLRHDLRATILRSMDLMKCAGLHEDEAISHVGAAMMKEAATLVGAICQPKDFPSLLKLFSGMLHESHNEFYARSRKATH
jgi:hypothetical protein